MLVSSFENHPALRVLLDALPAKCLAAGMFISFQLLDSENWARRSRVKLGEEKLGMSFSVLVLMADEGNKRSDVVGGVSSDGAVGTSSN